MSTPILDKDAVAKIVGASSQSQTATATYPITVTIYERFGYAWISWSLDPNYAIGENDCVLAIQVGTNPPVHSNYPVNVPVGAVQTTQLWGSGLCAGYFSHDFPTNQWKRLVTTPST